MITLTVGPNEVDNTKFGEILLRFRTRNKLARSEAAQFVGVSSEYMRLIERGERTPALGTALKLFELYSVSYELDKSRLIFKNTSVNFVSRIKEARHTNSKVPASRDKMIGQIVRALIVTDDDTLKKIHSKLVKG